MKFATVFRSVALSATLHAAGIAAGIAAEDCAEEGAGAGAGETAVFCAAKTPLKPNASKPSAARQARTARTAKLLSELAAALDVLVCNSMAFPLESDRTQNGLDETQCVKTKEANLDAFATHCD